MMSKMNRKKILLAEPQFPIPIKSKNHKNFLPIGLLKLASYYKNNGHKIKLARGNKSKKETGTRFVPDHIFITSLFTYWSRYVKDCVQHYKNLYPKAKVVVGGVYTSLMPEHCKKYTGCDEVFVGVHKEAEEFAKNHKLDYSLLDSGNPHPIDCQIIHATRGCPRKCQFCGVWKLEPTFESKKSIKNEINSNKLIFYDNNFLMNPYIEQLLKEITEFKHSGKSIVCESQSGFDGRILLEKPHLAKLVKEARFQNVRIAWDWDYSQHKQIKKQIDILVSAGYKSRDLYVFMLYNWKFPFKEMEKKRVKCWEWKVQISDCRYRPLEQVYDYYSPQKEQTIDDYYIHPKWMDNEIKQFRKNVRRQNICVRHGFTFYSKDLEQKRVEKAIASDIKNMSQIEVKTMLEESIISDFWYPDYAVKND